MVGLTQCASPSWTVYVDNFENDFFQFFDDSLLYPRTFNIENSRELMHGWTQSEHHQRRKIITAERNIDFVGDINVSFSTTETDNCRAGSDALCFSCIRWLRRDNAYITTFDFIRLVEYILDTTLSINGKGRIRRQLESFHPITINPLPNPPTIFDVIMDFDEPKARKLRKSIKVFLWDDLDDALNKVLQRQT